MLRHVAFRFLEGLLTLWCIATLSFLITRCAPGSPFSTEKPPDERVIAKWEQKYGLDRPLYEQYFRVLSEYARGDLGPSFVFYDQDVNDLVWPSFATSVQLGAISVVVALVAGILLGALAGARHNRWPDHVAMSVAVAGICLPNFVIGPLLILLFAPELGWPADFSPRELSKLLLPAFTLSLVHIAYLSRLTRAGMLEVLNQDYIRTARSKGLAERQVLVRHALRNAVTPALSYAGPMAALVITGSIVVEQIFNIPGLGRHFVDSALRRDMPVVMGCVLVYSTLVIVFNMVVDLLYGVLDPRVRR